MYLPGQNDNRCHLHVTVIQDSSELTPNPAAIHLNHGIELFVPFLTLVLREWQQRPHLGEDRNAQNSSFGEEQQLCQSGGQEVIKDLLIFTGEYTEFMSEHKEPFIQHQCFYCQSDATWDCFPLSSKVAGCP